MKVLLVKTSSLGDVVHAAPAVAEAARARPDVEIHWLVEESLADIARLHRDVRAVHTVATRRWRRRPAALRTWSELGSLRRQLQAEAYDLIVDAQGLLKSAAMARLAAAPIHGFSAASAREPAAALFYRRRHEVPRDHHAVERTRLLLAAALDYNPS